MQRGRGRGDLFDFGDPFAGFGGFGEHRSLMTSVFNKDPFDDPFFNPPFGSMFGPCMFSGPSMFAGPSMFGTGGSPFGDVHNSGFLEHQPPQANKSEGPVIEEVSSDDEKDDRDDKEKSDHPIKYPRSSKAILIEEPDDEGEDGCLVFGKKLFFSCTTFVIRIYNCCFDMASCWFTLSICHLRYFVKCYQYSLEFGQKNSFDQSSISQRGRISICCIEMKATE